MKPITQAANILPCLLLLIASSRAVAQSTVPSDLAGTEQRIYQGDIQTIKNLKNFTLPEAVPLLSKLIMDRSTDSARANEARVTLAAINGHGDFFRDYIINHESDPREKAKAFEVLSKLGSREAVRTLGFFLENDPTPARIYGEVLYLSGKDMAVAALAEMHLSGSPSEEADPKHKYNVSEWRAWWLAHKAEY